jgi:hypothetical protein
MCITIPLHMCNFSWSRLHIMTNFFCNQQICLHYRLCWGLVITESTESMLCYELHYKMSFLKPGCRFPHSRGEDRTFVGRRQSVDLERCCCKIKILFEYCGWKRVWVTKVYVHRYLTNPYKSLMFFYGFWVHACVDAFQSKRVTI